MWPTREKEEIRFMYWKRGIVAMISRAIDDKNQHYNLQTMGTRRRNFIKWKTAPGT